MKRSHAVRRLLTRTLASGILVASGLSAVLAPASSAGTISVPSLTLLPANAAANPEANLVTMSCLDATCVSIGSYVDTNSITQPYAVVTVGGAVLTSEEIPSPVNATISNATPVTASAISCTTGISCYIVGSYTTNGHLRPFITILTIATSNGSPTITNSIVGGIQLPSNYSTSPSAHSSVLAVHCTTPTNCLFVGQYDTATSSRIFAIVWNGRLWETPQVVPGPANALDAGIWVPSSVSCWNATDCQIFGEYRVTGSSLEVPVAVPFLNSVIGAPIVLPLPSDATTNGNVSAIRRLSSTCFSATSCLLVGSYLNNRAPSAFTETFVDTLVGTTWTSAMVPLGPNSANAVSQTPSSLSCVSPTLCVLAGSYMTTTGLMPAFWVNSKGVWSSPDILPVAHDQLTLYPTVNAASCSASLECTYAGSVSTQTSVQAAMVGQYDVTLPSGVTTLTASQTSASSATISWHPPVVVGTGIAAYTVTRTGTQGTMCVTVTTTCADVSITGGTTYTYTVTPTSNDGQVLPAASITLSVKSAPKTPFHVSVLSGSKSVTLKWSAATSGDAATSFVVVVKQGKATKTYIEASNVRAAMFGGLTAKVAVHITLQAHNVAGTSSPVTLSAVPKK